MDRESKNAIDFYGTTMKHKNISSILYQNIALSSVYEQQFSHYFRSNNR